MNDDAPLIIFLFLAVGVAVWFFFIRGKNNNNDALQVPYPHGGTQIPAEL